MSGSKRVTRRFTRGAVLPAAVAWMGLVGTSVGLMQAVCIPTPPETPLAANAGADASVVQGNVVTVLGSATGGTAPYSYVWAQTSGVAQSSTYIGAALSVTGVNPGAATFTLAVTDADGTRATDTVVVTVTAATPACTLAANAGADKTATGGDTVTLAATQTGGTLPVTWSWQLTSAGTAGTAAFVAGTDVSQTAQVTFSAAAAGAFTFQVTASDSAGCTASDSVVVTLTAATPTFVFTLDVDDLTGTAGDNVFSAPALYVAGTGQVSTLQTGDQAAGGEGADVLNAFLVGGANPVATLAGIETMNFTVFDADVLDATAWTDVTDVNMLNGDANLTVNNLGALADFSITNTVGNLTATFIAATVAGTTDAVAIALDRAGATGDAAAINIAGVEVFNVASGGSQDNIATLTGAALETVNVTGAEALDLSSAALPATVETFDASASTGGVDALFGAADVTATGGTGDDRLDFHGTYDDNDTVAGGTGTDTLVLNSAEAVLPTTNDEEQTNVTSIEVLELANALGGALDISYFGSIAEVVLTTGIDSGAARDLTVPSGTTITLEADTAAGAAAAHNFIVEGDGIADSMTLAMVDADFAESLDLEGVENCSLSSEDDATTFTNFEMVPSDPAGPSVGTSTLTITGEENVTFTSATVETINASALTGDLTVTVTGEATVTGGTGDDTMTATGANEVSFTGGAGDDTLVGSTDDDALSGGADDDTITGDDGADTIATGAGSDTIRYAAADDGGAADAGTTVGADLLSDFTVGADGDVLAFDGDVFKDTDAAADLVTEIDFQTITCGSDGTAAVGLTDPADATVLPVVVVTTTLDDWTAVETLMETTIAATFGATNDGCIAIVNVTGIGQIIVFDSDSDTDNDLVVLGEFDPTITLGSLVAGNFDEYGN